MLNEAKLCYKDKFEHESYTFVTYRNMLYLIHEYKR